MLGFLFRLVFFWLLCFCDRFCRELLGFLGCLGGELLVVWFWISLVCLFLLLCRVELGCLFFCCVYSGLVCVGYGWYFLGLFCLVWCCDCCVVCFGWLGWWCIGFCFVCWFWFRFRCCLVWVFWYGWYVGSCELLMVSVCVRWGLGCCWNGFGVWCCGWLFGFWKVECYF